LFSAPKNPDGSPANTPPVFQGLKLRIYLRLVTNGNVGQAPRILFVISLTSFPPADILSSSRQVQPTHRFPDPVPAINHAAKGLPIMAKKTTTARKQGATRNWVAYLCESLVTSGVMPTWEAATYLTENLFGEKPNPRLLSTINAYEVTSQFLQRLYHPLVEAASRDITLPDGAMLHVFTDISLTGKSAVLVVYVSGNNHPHQLLMLDAAKAWELVFTDSEDVNRWAEERYRWVRSALTAVIGKPVRHTVLAEVS
jgi:hypothetical protein